MSLHNTDFKDTYYKEAGNIFLAYYAEAADLLGVKYEIMVRSLIMKFTYQNKHWFIIAAVTPINNVTSTTVARRKNLAYQAFEMFDIPVAKQLGIHSEQEALDFFNNYEDIVFKPVKNIGGTGITVLPRSEEQVKKAFKLAQEKDLNKGKTKVLGEEYIDGEDYRLLVLDDEVIGAVRRKAAHVIGNGTDTVEELIKEANKLRKEKTLKDIKVDEIVDNVLAEQDYTMESIPEDGATVTLRHNSNLSQGGTTQECMAEVSEEIKDAAVAATKALDLKFGGVDVIAKDISDPSKRFVINEINYNPGLRVHYAPYEGKIEQVAIPIMRYMMENHPIN